MDYSLWKQGRDASGHIVSMTPHECPGEPLSVGPLATSLKALNTIARFGIWYEKHQMRQLHEAAFEERRHAWLNDILQQWIDEHITRSGIRIDVTRSVAKETRNLFEALVETKRMDVPQSLLLRCQRMSDYFDDVALFWANVTERLVDRSASHADWIWDAQSSDTTTQAVTNQMLERSEFGLSRIAIGAAGLGVFMIPGAGLIAGAFGGGTIGTLIGEEMDRRELRKQAECAEQYPEILRLLIASEQLADVAQVYTWFMERQHHLHRADLFVTGQGADAALVLARAPRPWYKRFVASPEKPPTLDALPSPVEDPEGVR